MKGERIQSHDMVTVRMTVSPHRGDVFRTLVNVCRRCGIGFSQAGWMKCRPRDKETFEEWLERHNAELVDASEV